MILCLETATPVCSVALNDGCCTLALRESEGNNVHSEKITRFIQEVMETTGLETNKLDAVAVSRGPGSYTGLRIGVSTAKGMAYSLGIPVITVSTLESIAQGAKHQARDNCDIVPMIDARRMEVFAARYDSDMNLLNEVAAVIVDENAYSELLQKKEVLFCGNGMPKCKELLSQFPNARFADFTLSAQYMLPTALKKWEAKDFADTAYFEPFYLKEYVAGKPNVKGLH